jgi:hypothetical protein
VTHKVTVAVIKNNDDGALHDVSLAEAEFLGNSKKHGLSLKYYAVVASFPL